MSTAKVALIESVNDKTDRWRIVARVIRKWNVYQKEAPAEVFCISMLLADELGCKIQASVMSKALLPRYSSLLEEGKVYFFANFVVVPNTKEYRATNHQFRINFGQQTYVKELEGAIPDYSYTFFPIFDIKQVDEKHPVDDLIDVIGYVTSIGSLEEYRVNGETKNRIRLTLADKEGLSVNCMLYDECALNVCLIDLGKLEALVVMILQLARVGFDDEGHAEVCSSFYATKISINEKCPEVKHFIQSTKEVPSLIISTILPSGCTQSTNQSPYIMLRSHPRINICEIAEHDLDSFFLIYCEVVKLDTRYGWMYEGCSKCGSKPKVDSNKFMCLMCKRIPNSIEAKFKIYYTVMDETGKASVVFFFDKFDGQLIKRSASELKDKLDQEDRSYDFPDELDDMVGRKMLLRLKLNKYNKDYPNSSISVAGYTECLDLMNEFNDAYIEEPDQNHLVQSQERTCVVLDNVQTDVVVPEVVSGVDEVNVVDVNPKLDDIPISHVVQKATIRGKRKQVWKKVDVSTENVGNYMISSPTKAPSNLLKCIKKEKM